MIDLKESYGKRYRIFMDEAWYVETADSNPNKIRDRHWYYEIRGRYGKIYIYGGSNKLAVHITSNVISGRVERDNTDIFGLYLKTSEGSIFLFNKENFEFVARLIKARKKRQTSEKERLRLRNISGLTHYKKQMTAQIPA